MKAGRRGGLCRVSPVGNAFAARLLPCSAKKRNRIWKFRVSKCDFFLGCRGDAGVARALCLRPGGRLVMVKE